MGDRIRKYFSFAQELISDLFSVWAGEMKQVLKDAGVVIFFIIVPLAYPLIYAYIYNNETVHEVPVIVVDQSASSESREFLRLFDGSSEVKIAQKATDMDEAQRFMWEKKGYGILYIPDSFSKDIAHGQQTYVSLYADMSSLLFYKAMLITATEVSLEMGKEIQIKNLSNQTAAQEEITATPIRYDNVNMFNPKGGFASFLVLAILVLIIQQTLLLGVGMLEGTNRGLGRTTPVRLINGHRYVGTARLVIGKAMCYLMIYALTTVWLLFGIPHLFSLPQVGNIEEIMQFSLPYVLACIFFAMSLSKIVRDRETPFILYVFTSVPLLFISGISWPQTAIPEIWKILSYIFPSTSGVQGFIKLNSMGATLWEVKFEYLLLWGLTGFYFLTTCLVYHFDLVKRMRKKGTLKTETTE